MRHPVLVIHHGPPKRRSTYRIEAVSRNLHPSLIFAPVNSSNSRGETYENRTYRCSLPGIRVAVVR